MNGEKPAKRNSALDKLSNLPGHVLDQILSRLPIRDAVRTSVLSSKWRFKWTTIPNLVFDKEWLSLNPKTQRLMKKKLVHLIDQALLLHTGPVYKFMLYQRDPITTTDIDRWIIYLSRCLVQEFILEIWDGQCYRLHSCLYSFQDLVHLDLFRCDLKLPSTFGGFKKLKRLQLKSLTMAQDVFETLISSCPILESLALFHVYGLTHLNIDAPNLLHFAFSGYFDDINFINTSNLAILSIILVFAGAAIEGTEARDSSNLLKLLSSLPCIRRLEIEHDFMQYLSNGDLPRQVSNLYPDLGYLHIDIGMNDYGECSAALFLLRSCPNIQELDIRVHLYEPLRATFWENKHKDCSFNRLQTVNISGDSGNKNVLQFIQFMLLATPVLQKMTFKPSSENQALRLAKDLLRFQLQRASAEAEVVFLESYSSHDNFAT